MLELEPHHIESIGLHGKSHITSGALRQFFEQGISVFWTDRNGALLGRVIPKYSRTADLRIKQFRFCEDKVKSLELAHLFIEAKINNAAAIISTIRSNRPGIQCFGNIISKLNLLKTLSLSAENKEILIGLEGEAAHHYFQAFGMAISDPFEFTKRQRRPPPDPVNALLSFGYVLLTNKISTFLEARSLDPYFGVLHTVRSGRPSLALDILEEFRHPVVDRFVLKVCNRQQFTQKHFSMDTNNGTRLNKVGLRRFFQYWEKYLEDSMAGIEEEPSVNDVIRRQINRLASHFREKEKYTPVRIGTK